MTMGQNLRPPFKSKKPTRDPEDAAMCPPPPESCDVCAPPSRCYDTLLRLRMMRCVLHHAKVAAQAVIARKVVQEPCPQLEEVCCDVFSLPSGCCDVFFLPSGCCDVFFLPSGCCDVFSPLSSSCNVLSTSPKHRMMLCVLSLTQASAQEVTFKKVDQHAPPPPPEEVNDDVHDRLEVTDEQGGRGLAVSVFLLSHIGFILRRVFPQVLFPSISYLGMLLSLLLLHPSPTTLLHIPQPSLHIRARTAVLGWRSARGVSVVRRKYRGRVGAVYKNHQNY